MSLLDRLTFRRALAADAEAVAALVNSAYRGDSSRAGWTTEADLLGGQRTDAGEILRLAQMAGSLVLLALDDAEIVGSVHLERVDGETACLGMLVVKPVLQDRGLGKQLMQAAEACVRREWHAMRLEMQVIVLRRELIAYYRRQGYRCTGKFRKFPDDPRFGVPRVAGLRFEVLEKLLG